MGEYKKDLPKKAICPCSAFSARCGTNILEPKASVGENNALKKTLMVIYFNSYVSYHYRGIHHNHLICILLNIWPSSASLNDLGL